MTKQTAALNLALEALEKLKRAFFKNAPDGVEDWERDWVESAMSAITAIREALAEQPAQVDPCIDGSCSCCWTHLDEQPAQPKLSDYEPDGMHHNKPQKRPQNCGTGYCSCIECPYEQPAQEPVAWLHPANATCVTTDSTAYARGIPLYTSPPASKPWVGLVHEETHEAIDTAGVDLLELAKLWSDNKVHVYQFDNEARKIIEAVLRRASAKLREKNA